MKWGWAVPIMAILTIGSMPSRPYSPTPARCKDVIDPYAISSAMSGCPIEYLQCLAKAESSGGIDTTHHNPLDRGWYGLHERKDYHAERAEKYGEYGADDPIESGRVAGLILMDHYAFFGSMELAYTAYHRGRAWAIRNGVDWNYLAKLGITS